MPLIYGEIVRRAISAAWVLALGAGLVLYQMTSLLLGSPSSRQLQVSLVLPAVDVEPVSTPVVSYSQIAVGNELAPAPAATVLPIAFQKPAARPTAPRPAAKVVAPVSAGKPTAVTPVPVTVVPVITTPSTTSDEKDGSVAKGRHGGQGDGQGRHQD
jgi:hypothetical protein